MFGYYVYRVRAFQQVKDIKGYWIASGGLILGSLCNRVTSTLEIIRRTI